MCTSALRLSTIPAPLVFAARARGTETLLDEGLTSRFGDEQVQRLGVVFERAAVGVLPVGASLRVAALRILRLRKLAEVFGGLEEVDELSMPVLLDKHPVAVRAVGDAQI